MLCLNPPFIFSSPILCPQSHFPSNFMCFVLSTLNLLRAAFVCPDVGPLTTTLVKSSIKFLKIVDSFSVDINCQQLLNKGWDFLSSYPTECWDFSLSWFWGLEYVVTGAVSVCTTIPSCLENTLLLQISSLWLLQSFHHHFYNGPASWGVGGWYRCPS